MKKLYERFEGDMNTIMQHLFFYEFDREDEYREIIAEAIKYKEVTGKYKATFLKESADSIKKRKQKVSRNKSVFHGGRICRMAVWTATQSPLHGASTFVEAPCFHIEHQSNVLASSFPDGHGGAGAW